jgi:HK97 gp10 family phage protein
MSDLIVEIEGLDELKRKLKSSTAAEPARKFLQRCGDAIEGQAKPITPVRTGRLRNSITTRVGTETPVPQTVVVGTNVRYAPFVELGTRRMRPRPYLQTGMQAAVPQINTFVGTLANELEEAYRNGG